MKFMLAKDHRRLVVICAAVVAVVAAALTSGFLLGSPSDGAPSNRTSAEGAATLAVTTGKSPVPTTSAGTQRTPEPKPVRLDRATAVREASVALKSFLELSDKALQSPKDDLGQVAAVAQGPAKGELENTVDEFRDTRIRQAGSVRIADEQAVEVERENAPYRVTLEVCIDATDVTITNNRGKPVSARPANEVRRTPHLYTVELAGKAWKVVEHRFPAESTC